MYAPTGGGNLDLRYLTDPVRSARAVSAGYSRPFRVLSPITTIKLTTGMSGRTPRDTALKLQPTVVLKARPSVTSTGQLLQDTCSDAPASPLDQLTQSGQDAKKRCPPTPEGGLEVTASAVNVDTQVEYPLYVAGRQLDCARAEAGLDAELGEVYIATFTGLQFPTFPDVPAGTVGGTVGGELPLGRYNLRFTAYGTSVTSSDVVVITNTPDTMVVGQPLGSAPVFSFMDVVSDGYYANVTDAQVIPAVVGRPIAPGLAAVVAVDSDPAGLAALLDDGPVSGCTLTAGSNLEPGVDTDTTCVPVPGVSVQLRLVAGPLNSNAAIRNTGSLVGSNGTAGFWRTVFTAGASGLYRVQFLVDGLTPDVAAHSLLLNVTNPLTALTLTVGGSATVGKSAAQPIRYEQGGVLGDALRVCAAPADRTAVFTGAAVAVRVALVAKLRATRRGSLVQRVTAGPAADTAYDPVYGNVFDTAPGGLVDTRALIDLQPTWGGGVLGADNCVTIPSFGFRRIPASMAVQVSFAVHGVETPPLCFEVVTVQDAHPVSVADLRARVMIPLAMAIAPFGVNTLWHAVPLRGVIAAGAIGSLAAMWVTGGAPFFDDAVTLRSFYPSRDLRFLDALNVAFAIVLAVLAAVYVAAAVALAGVTVVRAASTCRPGPMVGPAGPAGARMMAAHRSGGGGSGGGVRAVTTGMADRLYDVGAGRGFYGQKLEAAFAYATYKAPRSRHTLIDGAGMLHAAFIEALGEVYTRYTLESAAAVGKTAAWTDLEARRTKGTLARLRDVCRRRARPDSTLPGVVDAAGRARLLSDLFAAATGEPLESLRGDDGAPALSLGLWRDVCTHRLARFGVVTVACDLTAVLGRLPVASAGLVYATTDWTAAARAPAPTATAAVQFTDACVRYIGEAHAVLAAAAASRLESGVDGAGMDPLAAYGVAVLSILDADLAAFWRRLATAPLPLTFEAFAQAYHDRLLTSLLPSTTPAAATAAATTPILDSRSHPRRTSLAAIGLPPTPPHPVLTLGAARAAAAAGGAGGGGGTAVASGGVATRTVCDEHVWAELREWGYDTHLQYRMVAGGWDRDAPTPAVATALTPSPLCAAVLSIAFREANDDPASHWITLQQLNGLRSRLGQLPVRDIHFSRVAHAFDAAAPLPEGWAPPAAPAVGVATVEERVDPALYVALVTGRWTTVAEVDADLARMCAALGYNARMRCVGAPQMADAVQRGRASLAAPAVRRYVAHLGHLARAAGSAVGGNTAGASPTARHARVLMSVASVHHAVPPLAFFYPQRFIIAAVVSCVALAFAFMYAVALTGQVSNTIETAWDNAVTARTSALQRALDNAEVMADRNLALARAAVDSVFASAAAQAAAAQAAAQAAAGGTGATTINVAALLRDPQGGLAAAGVVGSGVASDTAATLGPTVQQAVAAAVAAAAGAGVAGASDVGPALSASLSAMQATLATLQLAATTSATDARASASAVLGQVSAAAATALDSILVSTDLNQFASVKEDVVSSISNASVAAAVLAALVVAACWVMQFSSLKAATLRARTGHHPFVWAKNPVSRASTYIGVQTALCIISFFLLWFVLALVLLVLSMQSVRAVLWDTVLAAVLALLGTGLAISLSQTLLMTRLLTTGDTIVYLRLYLAADMVYSMLNLFVGAIIAILRFVWSFLIYLAVFARADRSPLALEQEHRDPARGAYNAMMLQHLQYSNPLRMVFAHLLIDAMHRRRAVAAAAAHTAAASAGGGLVKRTISLVGATAVSALSPEQLAHTRARNRWHLAVVLALNPSLRKYRVRDAAADPALSSGNPLRRLMTGMKKLTPTRAGSAGALRSPPPSPAPWPAGAVHA